MNKNLPVNKNKNEALSTVVLTSLRISTNCFEIWKCKCKNKLIGSCKRANEPNRLSVEFRNFIGSYSESSILNGRLYKTLDEIAQTLLGNFHIAFFKVRKVSKKNLQKFTIYKTTNFTNFFLVAWGACSYHRYRPRPSCIKRLLFPHWPNRATR